MGFDMESCLSHWLCNDPIFSFQSLQEVTMLADKVKSMFHPNSLLYTAHLNSNFPDQDSSTPNQV